jgi:hypothetical protein
LAQRLDLNSSITPDLRLHRSLFPILVKHGDSAAAADTLRFQYQSGNQALGGTFSNSTGWSNTGWTGVSQLDFTTPVTGTAGLVDGNAAGNRTAINYTITGLSITNGTTYTLRWIDQTAGSSAGMAIDDFTLSAVFAPTTGNYWNGASAAWSSSSTNWATATAGGGTTGVTQATSGALVFDTASAAVTVNDTVTVNAGITFGANGITISPGTGTPLISRLVPMQQLI